MCAVFWDKKKNTVSRMSSSLLFLLYIKITILQDEHILLYCSDDDKLHCIHIDLSLSPEEYAHSFISLKSSFLLQDI